MVWELDHKEGWAQNWCYWNVVLKKTLESPLDSKEIKAVNPKWNQHWIFIGRTDAEAEAPILWPSDSKSQLTEKRPWCWKRLKAGREGPTEDKMVGWHYQLNGHKFEKTLGVGDGQGSLACCSPWVAKSRTRLSNWTKLKTHTNKLNFIKLHKAGDFACLTD